MLIAGLVMLAAALTPAAGEKQPPVASAVEVTAIGACPDTNAVRQALVPLLTRPASLTQIAETPTVEDRGDSFVVTAAGEVGEYVDRARDCPERARASAVFIALALNPPALRSRAAPPARTLPATAARVPAPRRWSVELGAAARIDGAPGSAWGFMTGGEGRLVVRRSSVGGALSVGALAPATARFGSVPVRQQRFFMNAAASGRAALARHVAVSADLGLAAALLTLRPQDLATAEESTHLGLGGHVAVQLRFPVERARLAAFVGAQAEYFPHRYLLDVDPLGSIGTVPRFWVGASAGIAFDLRRAD